MGLYLTTPIFYVNAQPHLGHAYTAVVADTVCRFARLEGREVFFQTGTDEHGDKIVQAAEAAKMEVRDYVDEISSRFRAAWPPLEVEPDNFIRTTDPAHIRVVQNILQQVHERGDIYFSDYDGLYCKGCERFLTEKELIDGNCPDHLTPPEKVAEQNYFFKMSRYQQWLIDHIKANPEFITPERYRNEVLSFLSEPLEDLCISRPVSRLAWGIPLPFDPRFVTYVWFDALINYISGIGYGTEGFSDYWPADYHVIGKDILVPSHSVYWTAMLKAIGVEPPKALLVHGWWHVGGEKMSKSTGLKIDPIEFADTYGADSLRYFLTREMSVGQDSDFSLDLFLGRYNADLANNLGNLVSRLLNMAGRHFPEGLAEGAAGGEPEATLRGQWETTREEVLLAYEQFQFHIAMEKTFAFITSLNRYAEIRAPWKLAKSEDAADRELLAITLASLGEGLRLANAFLKPVMPEISDRISGLLGVNPVERWENQLEWGNRLTGVRLGGKTILFPRPSSED